MIDSHCHLAAREFEHDLSDVLARAHEVGISTMITIGDTIGESKDCLKIASEYPSLFAAIGVHPHHAKDFDADRDGTWFTENASHSKCKAIGEIGLDYHYMHSPKSDQRIAFRVQLQLAKELKKPAVVHTREALDDTWEILQKVDHHHIVIHCCTEAWKDIERFVKEGYFLSFTGIATYPKSDAIRDTIKHCPLEQMMIETDAPYLSPVPYRGKRNEPAFVKEVAACIADVKGISLEEVDRVTTENAKKFFGLS